MFYSCTASFFSFHRNTRISFPPLLLTLEFMIISTAIRKLKGTVQHCCVHCAKFIPLGFSLLLQWTFSSINLYMQLPRPNISGIFRGFKRSRAISQSEDPKESTSEVDLEKAPVHGADANVSALAVAEDLTQRTEVNILPMQPSPAERHRKPQQALARVPPRPTIQDFHNEIQWHQQENYNLQMRLRQASDEYNQMSTELQKYKEGHTRLLRRYNELKDNCNELNDINQDLVMKNDQSIKEYDDLYQKHVAIVGALQVTNDDHATIKRKLTDMIVAIETLAATGLGEDCANVNIDAATELFWKSGLLQTFSAQVQPLESLHLSHCFESIIMTTLMNHLLRRPLQCIFGQGHEFESICHWVEKQGSPVSSRWRQELCKVLAKNSKRMSVKKKKAVDFTASELKNLISQVCLNVNNTGMFDQIDKLCDKTFDLSFAMFGMESKIYPSSTRLNTPFSGDVMEMAWGSNPEGLVSLSIFPTFKDRDTIFLKSKVWCL